MLSVWFPAFIMENIWAVALTLLSFTLKQRLLSRTAKTAPNMTASDYCEPALPTRYSEFRTPRDNLASSLKQNSFFYMTCMY